MINLKKIWHDPVGSKVIAGLILTSIGASYAYWPIVKKLLSNIWQLTISATTLPNWLIAVLFIISAKSIISRLKTLERRTNNSSPAQKVAPQQTAPQQTSPLAANFPEPQMQYTGKRFVHLPKVPLNPQQQVWINHLYQSFLQGINTSAHVMKMRLVSSDQIPKDFSYKSIDERLINAGDNTITLFGIYNVNQATDLPEKLDVIIRYIRQLINNDPQIADIPVKELNRTLGISERDISTAIILGKQCRGMSWLAGSYGSNKDPLHYLNLITSFNVNNEHSFQFYSEYEDIETSLSNAYK